MSREPVGTFCLVLHCHLPWLAHHGRWPVGEEWLYQAWAHAYLPVVDVAASAWPPRAGATCSPSASRRCSPPSSTTRTACAAMHDWLGGLAAARARGRARLPDLAPASTAPPPHALEVFERDWRHGASPVLRRAGRRRASSSCSAGPPRTRSRRCCRGACARSRCDAGSPTRALRLGRRPAGIWAPECGYAPGHGARLRGGGRASASSSTARRCAATPRPRAPSAAPTCVAFGRDLEVTYRVWSPRAGYPGGPDYRDFHTYDHASGLKPARVTGRRVADRGQAALRPGARRRGRGARRRRTSCGVVRARLDGAAGAARAAGARRRGVRHRAVRALVARGPGVAGGGAARAARGRGAGDDAARRGRGRASRRAGGAAARRRGGRARTGGCGTGSQVRDLVADNERRAAPPARGVDGAPPSAGRDADPRRAGDPGRCSRCPATGRSWSPRTPPRDYARRRAAQHRDRVRELDRPARPPAATTSRRPGPPSSPPRTTSSATSTPAPCAVGPTDDRRAAPTYSGVGSLA